MRQKHSKKVLKALKHNTLTEILHYICDELTKWLFYERKNPIGVES